MALLNPVVVDEETIRFFCEEPAQEKIEKDFGEKKSEDGGNRKEEWKQGKTREKFCVGIWGFGEVKT